MFLFFCPACLSLSVLLFFFLIAGNASAEGQAKSNSATALEERECREKGWGLARAMERADYRIDNSGSLEDLRRKVVKLVGEIEKGVSGESMVG